jgi:Fe-S oxidoreductase
MGWMRPLAGLANPVARSRPFRWAMETGMGVARQRVLPPLSRQAFSGQFKRRSRKTDGEPVVLFVDTFTELNHPELGHAAVRVLEAAGCQVLLAVGQACCGRTMISKGLLGRARERANQNVRALGKYARQGVPIVGLEPSCLLMLRDEYLDLLPGDEDAIAIAATARLIEEFLTEATAAGSSRLAALDLSPRPGKVLLHNHCHSKALVGSGPALAMLRAMRSEVEEIQSGCCGMAGSFGYEVEHYALSMQIGELKLFPRIREESARTPTLQIVAPGMSCRSQIRDGTGATASHPVMMLAEALVDHVQG